MASYVLNVSVSLVPVFLFLAALIFLDSYKLVKLRDVIFTILIGCIVSYVSYWVNTFVLQSVGIPRQAYIRYGSPLVEEIFKAAYIMYLMRSQRIGFMVDAAIYGFAVGAGFAFIENIYYLQSFGREYTLFDWIIRGFGTAVMHGGTMSIFAIISKNFADTKGSERWDVFLPGLATGVVVHSFFNHFFLQPLIFTSCILVFLPIILIFVFSKSERVTRSWLGVGFDSDAELLKMIVTGDVAKTRIGEYLQTLQTRFRGETVADLLCYLRIYLELAIQAKGILMMRQAGFDIPPDPDIQAKFNELQFLRKSIGKTGQLAMSPFVRTKGRDLWQLQMLQK
ncbi:MAG TPA: PrsW family glutamic-type intramembrane protease [Bacteroidota bacterium]|nr:PrsW family glutamic-type intramembrane protease [Bacteroidota bacterium]